MIENLASRIDHTNLKPTATQEDIELLCKEAVQYQFKAVCVPPIFVQLASKILIDRTPLVCTVVGFPMGYDHLSAKITSAKISIEEGADELDAVISISKVKSGNWEMIEREIESLTTIIKIKASKTFKLILETAYLTDEELKILCNLCNRYDVDFAKTSTGMAPLGATVEVIEKMRDFLKPEIQIKASGGIRVRSFAENLIHAGADRLGASSSIALVS